MNSFWFGTTKWTSFLTRNQCQKFSHSEKEGERKTNGKNVPIHNWQKIGNLECIVLKRKRVPQPRKPFKLETQSKYWISWRRHLKHCDLNREYLVCCSSVRLCPRCFLLKIACKSWQLWNEFKVCRLQDISMDIKRKIPYEWNLIIVLAKHNLKPLHPTNSITLEFQESSDSLDPVSNGDRSISRTEFEFGNISCYSCDSLAIQEFSFVSSSRVEYLCQHRINARFKYRICILAKPNRNNWEFLRSTMIELASSEIWCQFTQTGTYDLSSINISLWHGNDISDDRYGGGEEKMQIEMKRDRGQRRESQSRMARIAE